MQKPCAPACDRNRDPILSIIGPLFTRCRTVLEIGSGTGQHAVYFAARLPHLRWLTSDLPGSHDGIRLWLQEAALPNVATPVELDVTGPDWRVGEKVDAVFSANTAHIMSWPTVCAMITGVARLLPPGGPFALYGPFNYGGRYTSESNARFDQWLGEQDPVSAIRDFEEVDRVARENGLLLAADHAMPSNNRMLVWTRQ